MADKAFKIGRRSFLGGSAFLAGATSVPVLGSTSGNLIAGMAASTATEPLYGPPPGVAKLNANENPYGPSPLAIKAMTRVGHEGNDGKKCHECHEGHKEDSYEGNEGQVYEYGHRRRGGGR